MAQMLAIIGYFIIFMLVVIVAIYIGYIVCKKGEEKFIKFLKEKKK